MELFFFFIVSRYGYQNTEKIKRKDVFDHDFYQEENGAKFIFKLLTALTAFHKHILSS